MKTKVLIYGKDTVLLQTRCNILELAGHHCRTVTDLHSIVTSIAKDNVG